MKIASIRKTLEGLIAERLATIGATHIPLPARQLLEISTTLGQLSIPREKIRLLRVRPRGEYRASDDTPARPKPLPYHAAEPLYEGKSLRWWLNQAGPKIGFGNIFDSLSPEADAKSADQQAAERAIQATGSEAVPFLVEMLSRGDPDARRAVRGFAALGEQAKKALPDLLILLDEPDDIIHFCTIGAIGYLGPSAASAVPILLDELRSGSLPAAEALGNIGPGALEAEPIMLDMIKSPPQGYDLPLIIALGKIHASDAVPVLAEIARGTGRSGDFVAEMRRHRAVEALGRIGPNATQSVPLLVHLLDQQGLGNLGQLYLADRICRALGEMGPSAHEAIPVLTRLVSNQSQLKSHATVSQSAAAALARIQPKQQ